jgi:hypothetical protein
MYMYIHIYIHTHTYMHACMHACIHTYIHIYKGTFSKGTFSWQHRQEGYQSRQV